MQETTNGHKSKGGIQNVAVKWSVILLPIWEISGSNLGSEVTEPD
jgi:hypothetical protein